MPKSAWDFVLERKTPLHIHRCPMCYDQSPCLLDCTIEPDLEREDGMPSGTYICCSLLCAAGNDSYLADAYDSGFDPTDYIEAPKEQLG